MINKGIVVLVNEADKEGWGGRELNQTHSKLDLGFILFFFQTRKKPVQINIYHTYPIRDRVGTYPKKTPPHYHS